MHRRRFLQLVGIAPPTLIFATACSSAQSGVTVKLDHGPPAALGGTMTFMLTATSVWDAPDPDSNGTKTTDAEVGFLLTDGLKLLSADYLGQVLRPGTTSYSRKVMFKAKQPQTFEVEVKLNTAGAHELRGHAKVSNSPNGSVDSGADAFYLKVDYMGIKIQRDPFAE